MRGFLINSASVFSKKGLFLNHHFNNYIEREDKRYVRSYEVGFSDRTSNLKKVFGEFFEREVLINNNEKKESQLPINSLIDNSTKKINTNSIVFVDQFVDSCGMASHTSSQEIIKTAYLEFFERQCFISNYLGKLPGTEYILKENGAENDIHDYLKNYTSVLRYYDISLIEDVYVILCIGYGRRKCIGLGTSSSLREAVHKSQIEALQYFANQKIKIDNTENVKDTLINDQYHFNFENLSIKDFKKNYAYLLTGSNKLHVDFIKGTYVFDFEKFIEKCSTLLKMNPYVAFLSTDQKIPHLKVIKIIDENWFPHMNPEFYNEKHYSYVSKILNKDLDKTIQFIPFP